ncbi:MAG: PIN domain-containing protein [Opitutales bacterium]|nr:PIN domain-containing protein [Opitutales bacterium]
MIAADFRVCLDACVLANHGVADLFLRLAEKPRMYSPVLSRQILDEVHRVHVDRLGWPTDLADYFQREVSGAFAEAIVDDYEDLLPILTNDEGDRHVLAAAIKGKAELIVTHIP